MIRYYQCAGDFRRANSNQIPDGTRSAPQPSFLGLALFRKCCPRGRQELASPSFSRAPLLGLSGQRLPDQAANCLGARWLRLGLLQNPSIQDRHLARLKPYLDRLTLSCRTRPATFFLHERRKLWLHGYRNYGTRITEPSKSCDLLPGSDQSQGVTHGPGWISPYSDSSIRHSAPGRPRLLPIIELATACSGSPSATWSMLPAPP